MDAATNAPQNKIHCNDRGNSRGLTVDYSRNLTPSSARRYRDRVLEHLQLLDGDFGGFPIDRLTHCLQSASLAHCDGRDEEYVVMALLHDIRDTLAPYNHTDVAAVILKPFVSERTHWIAAHHGVFQGYYFFHHLGLDRNMRDQFKDSPYYEDCAEFVAKYGQNAFDRDYEDMTLEEFRPMVERVLSEPRNSIYIKKD